MNEIVTRYDSSEREPDDDLHVTGPARSIGA